MRASGYLKKVLGVLLQAPDRSPAALNARVYVQSKRVQKNIGTRTSPWISRIIKGNQSNNNKNNNKEKTESSTLAKPPMFLCGVPTVIAGGYA